MKVMRLALLGLLVAAPVLSGGVLEQIEVETSAYRKPWFNPFDTLRLGGAGYRFDKPGKVVLRIDLQFYPKWEGDERNMKFKPEEIKLVDSAGKEMPFIGLGGSTLEELKLWSKYTMNIHKPGSGAGGKPRADFKHLLYEVPEKAGDMTLHIGENQVPVKMPAQIQELPPAQEWADYEVVATKLYPGGLLTKRHGDEEVLLDALSGGLLQVDVKVTPKQTNAAAFGYQKGFVLSSLRMLIKPKGGGLSAAAGGTSFGNFHEQVSWTHRLAEDKDKDFIATLYFAVPDGMTEFDLYYLWAPVAKGTVGMGEPAQMPRDMKLPGN